MIHENLKKLKLLRINLKSLKIDTALSFFRNVKKFLICNVEERFIDTINYIVNF